MPASPNNPRRLAQWFRELRVPLRRFIAARRGLAPADLDDVAQEVFLRLLRYDRDDLVTDPRGYLFKIAANVASEWSMRASRRLPHESSWLDDLVEDPRAYNELELIGRNRAIQKALGKLPPRACEILRLQFHENLTHEQIANRLGVSPRVVKRDIVNAYASLRVELASHAGTEAAERT